MVCFDRRFRLSGGRGEHFLYDLGCSDFFFQHLIRSRRVYQVIEAEEREHRLRLEAEEREHRLRIEAEERECRLRLEAEEREQRIRSEMSSEICAEFQAQLQLIMAHIPGLQNMHSASSISDGHPISTLSRERASTSS